MRQRSGLGEEFITEIGNAIEYAAEHPERYPTVFGDLRRTVSRRFHTPFTFAHGKTRWWSWPCFTEAVIQPLYGVGLDLHGGRRPSARRGRLSGSPA